MQELQAWMNDLGVLGVANHLLDDIRALGQAGFILPPITKINNIESDVRLNGAQTVTDMLDEVEMRLMGVTLHHDVLRRHRRSLRLLANTELLDQVKAVLAALKTILREERAANRLVTPATYYQGQLQRQQQRQQQQLQAVAEAARVLAEQVQAVLVV